jgi:hypothetical protein
MGPDRAGAVGFHQGQRMLPRVERDQHRDGPATVRLRLVEARRRTARLGQ